MTTPGAAKPLTVKRKHWITAEALRGFRERVKGYPQMEDDQLADTIDGLIVRGIEEDYWEDVIDNGEVAKLVMIHTTGSEGCYAFLKKANNNKKFDLAAVAVFTQSQVGQFRKNNWTVVPEADDRWGFSERGKNKMAIPHVVPSSGGSEPISLSVATGRRQETRTFLLSYIPIKKLGEEAVRQYEEWSTPSEIEKRLTEIKAVPDTVRVYKELSIRYRIDGY